MFPSSLSAMEYPLASSTWGDEEIEALNSVIKTGRFTMGEKVREFEEAFASKFGSKYAVMSNSGSSANLLAVAAIRYSSKYDSTKTDIIVPAVSWSTTYYPIHQLGFRLKFVDVSLDTLNAGFESIAEAVDEHTAGIFAVNLLGNPAELDKLRALADERGIFLLEDNCESMGAKLSGEYTGTFGDVGTFSFFFSHHISTMEGGMSLTDSRELAEIMRSLRAHGWTRDLSLENVIENKTGDPFYDSFRFVLPGYNLRPLELSAAVGLVQLQKFDSFLQARRENAQYFKSMAPKAKKFRTQQEIGESSWFGFSLIVNPGEDTARGSVLETLKENGIEVRPIVAGNFLLNPVVSHLNIHPHFSVPNANEIHKSGFFVGNHHFDLEDRLAKLIDVLSSVT